MHISECGFPRKGSTLPAKSNVLQVLYNLHMQISGVCSFRASTNHTGLLLINTPLLQAVPLVGSCAWHRWRYFVTQLLGAAQKYNMVSLFIVPNLFSAKQKAEYGSENVVVTRYYTTKRNSKKAFRLWFMPCLKNKMHGVPLRYFTSIR